MIREKIYKNGATLIYKSARRRCTSVTAGFVFGRNRDNYPEPTAHFLEHMFFKSTPTRDSEKLKEERLKIIGPSFNASTTLFSTRVHFKRTNKLMKECFELSSEMLLNSNLNEDEIESEKGVITQELVKSLSNTGRMYSRAIKRCLNKDYIRDCNRLGSEEEIKNITKEDLRKFREDIFISQNFLIAIEGGISYSKAKKLAEKYFINQLKSNPNFPVNRQTRQGVETEPNKHIENYPLKEAKCNLLLNLNLPFSEKGSWTAFILCSAVNGISGKLTSRLRDKGLVYDAGLYNSFDRRFDSCLQVEFSCANENINKVIDTMGEVFEELRTTKVSDEIVQNIKDNYEYSRDENIIDISSQTLFGDYLYFGSTKELTNKAKRRRKKIRNAITSDDILKLCQRAFSEESDVYMTILTNEEKDNFYSLDEIKNIVTKNKKH